MPTCVTNVNPTSSCEFWRALCKNEGVSCQVYFLSLQMACQAMTQWPALLYGMWDKCRYTQDYFPLYPSLLLLFPCCVRDLACATKMHLKTATQFKLRWYILYVLPSTDWQSATTAWHDHVWICEWFRYLGLVFPTLPPSLPPTQVTMTSGEVPESNPTIMVEFKIAQLAVSGIKVSRLDIYGEVGSHLCMHKIWFFNLWRNQFYHKNWIH